MLYIFTLEGRGEVAMSNQERPKPEQDPTTGRFLPGNSGNGGRPKGSKAKYAEAFWADLQHESTDAFVNLWQMISNGTAEQAIAKAKGEPQSEPDDPEEPVRH